MTFDRALERYLVQTGHERMRWLTGDENPDVVQREAYRRNVLAMAEPAPSYPPLTAELATAGRAIVHAATAFATGQPVFSDAAEIDCRLAICRACEHFVADEGRCEVCGCFMNLKTRLQREHCPLPEPKW